MPPPSTSRGGNNNGYRPNASSSGGTKRQRGAAANNNRNPTPLVSDTYPAHDQIPAAHTNGSRRSAAGDSYNNILPSTAHPSLPPPYGNTNGSGHNHVSSTYDVHGISHTHGISDALEWGIPRTQLEGPGMPVARSASLHSQAASVPTLHSAAAEPTDAGDGDGDGDDRTYCFCDRVSYGEMIACDDSQCEREWVCLVFGQCFLLLLTRFFFVDSSILLVLV